MVDHLSDYLELTKPGIVLLVLVTAYAAMLMAGPHLDFAIVLITLLGVALSAGSANTLNCYFDRDIDAIMQRTHERPIPAGRIAPDRALIFGIAVGVLSVVILGVFVNPLSAVIALSGNLFYVVVYTLWLKRSTPQNIVIGGAAGAVAPLIGWAAVTGHVGWPAVALFAIIFLWTPPHFWSLALYRNEDYRRAGVPMMPVVRGSRVTRRQIIFYSVLLTIVALSLYPMGAAGPVYLVVAAVLSAGLIWLSLRLNGTERRSKRLFLYSIAYLAFLFLAAVLG